MGIAGGEEFLPEAVPCGGACIASSLHRRPGEAPRGHVGDPGQGEVVVGIDEHPQQRHHILHLATVEERAAADQFVGNASAAEFLFEHTGLFAGAEENHSLGRCD